MVRRRVTVWRAVIGPWMRWGAVVIGVIGIFDLLRAQFLPDEDIPVVADILDVMPLWAWALILMGLIGLGALEGAYRIANPYVPEPPTARKGWLDLRIEGEAAIGEMSKELRKLNRDTRWIGERFTFHANQLTALQSDPNSGPKKMRRLVSGASRDLNRYSTQIERRLPELCRQQKQTAALLLNMAERYEAGHPRSLRDQSLAFAEEGILGALSGTASFFRSLATNSNVAPTADMNAAIDRALVLLASLLRVFAALYEAAHVYVDAADRRHTANA